MTNPVTPIPDYLNISDWYELVDGDSVPSGWLLIQLYSNGDVGIDQETYGYGVNSIRSALKYKQRLFTRTPVPTAIKRRAAEAKLEELSTPQRSTESPVEVGTCRTPRETLEAVAAPVFEQPTKATPPQPWEVHIKDVETVDGKRYAQLVRLDQSTFVNPYNWGERPLIDWIAKYTCVSTNQDAMVECDKRDRKIGLYSLKWLNEKGVWYCPDVA